TIKISGQEIRPEEERAKRLAQLAEIRVLLGEQEEAVGYIEPGRNVLDGLASLGMAPKTGSVAGKTVLLEVAGKPTAYNDILPRKKLIDEDPRKGHWVVSFVGGTQGAVGVDSPLKAGTMVVVAFVDNLMRLAVDPPVVTRTAMVTTSCIPGD